MYALRAARTFWSNRGNTLKKGRKPAPSANTAAWNFIYRAKIADMKISHISTTANHVENRSKKNKTIKEKV